MTRFNALALTLALTAGLIGCAATGDGVSVVTADLDGQHLELVEMYGDDGYVELELTYVVGDELAIDHEQFRWIEDAPTPDGLRERLATVDPELSQRLNVARIQPRRELGDDRGLIAPQLILEAAHDRAQGITADQDDQYVEMIETHEDGFIDVVVTLSTAGGIELERDAIAWPADAPAPDGLRDIMRRYDVDQLVHVTPIRVDIEPTARVEAQVDFVPFSLEYVIDGVVLENRALTADAPDCEMAGLADCAAQH